MSILIDKDGIGERWQEGVYMRPQLSANMSGEELVRAASDVSVNASLRKDEWEIIDERVNEEARKRLGVVDRWRTRGLVQSVSVGDIERVTERLEAFDAADLSFDGDTDPQEDRPNYQTDRRAIPVISQGFRINFRQLSSSSKRGGNLQVDSAGLAARSVAHRMQELVTNGLSSGAPSGGGIPGLTTASNRETVTLNNNWDGASADIIDDTSRMLVAAYAKNLFGPFEMHVPNNYWAEVQKDYKAEVETTFIDRILRFEDIEAVIPNDSLSDDEVLLVQMTRDVMDISEAQTMTTWQWEKTPAVTRFRVLMIAGPHIKSIEEEGGTTVNGIVHLS